MFEALGATSDKHFIKNRCGNWHRKMASEDVRLGKSEASWWPGGVSGEVGASEESKKRTKEERKKGRLTDLEIQRRFYTP